MINRSPITGLRTVSIKLSAAYGDFTAAQGADRSSVPLAGIVLKQNSVPNCQCRVVLYGNRTATAGLVAGYLNIAFYFYLSIILHCNCPAAVIRPVITEFSAKNMDFRYPVRPNCSSAKLCSSFGFTVCNLTSVHIKFSVVDNYTSPWLWDAKTIDFAAVHVKSTLIYPNSMTRAVIFKSIIRTDNGNTVVHMYGTGRNSIPCADSCVGLCADQLFESQRICSIFFSQM
ncbi:hypothetical protein NSA44_16655 [Flavonifractor plautii]|nr:hypothetical protein [Flavonifractor plautii]MCR1923254.1 hypothetical protein [Flavonifractor plautii]